MTHEKRWPSTREFGFREFWDDHRQRPRSSRQDVQEDDACIDGTLAQLGVGQSLIVIWEEGIADVEVEEPVACTGCGEVLTELRLSALYPSLSACPCCGFPPSA